MIYDTALRTKCYGFSPLQLLLYTLGYQLWAVGTGRKTSGGDTIGFIDTEWIRDSHAVLVKQKNQMEQQDTKRVVNILAGYLTDGQIGTILQHLVKRTETMEQTKDKNVNKMIKHIKLIQSENVKGQFTQNRKKQILQLWFKDIDIGPYMITRSLSIHDIPDYDCIEGPMIEIIRNNMSKDLFDVVLDHITLLDDRYFLIPGDDAQMMDWPHEVMYDFIGIAEENQKIDEKSTRLLKTYKGHHLKGLDEGLDESDDTKYFVTMEKNRFGVFLRLNYGNDVFGDINYVLNQIFNSEDFHNWLKSDAINLDLWCGRNEKDKIEDHQKLQQMYQEMVLKNQQLQAELSKYEE